MPTDPEEIPAIGGDPHVTRFDGVRFDFRGQPGGVYNLATFGEVSIHGRLLPIPALEPDGTPKTVVGVLVVKVGEVRVEIATGGGVHVSGGGIDLRVHAIGCSLAAHNPETDRPEDILNGVAYINYSLAEHPADLAGATGVMVDGHVESDPAAYEVEG